jgi:hypothetical protein
VPSLLAQFPDEVARHLEDACQNCGGQPFRADRPYEAEVRQA